MQNQNLPTDYLVIRRLHPDFKLRSVFVSLVMA